MSDREGLGALADACWYHCLRTAYALHRSVSTVYGSSHAPIPADDFSAHNGESYMRDLRKAFVRDLVTLGRW